ncbi:DUF397 domain-containing protein [Streptomyces sp. AC1-42W]|uniref:DUF397 domain-containing protein n=1 Tax=Streptomyces sp. AC1-42W TaxID=2218666 RepID=UPI000DAC64C9|nr:DUF397 domain-containing protein [Streptomyces sp. AC1-42W]PZT75451.1 DUF397 domain-containing protein [Streptomyces sp. AC1-42W]
MTLIPDENTPSPVWVKSSYSNGQGAECVEWAPAHAAATGEFLVRDSKLSNGPHLVLSRQGFAGLVEYAKRLG